MLFLLVLAASPATRAGNIVPEWLLWPGAEIPVEFGPGTLMNDDALVAWVEAMNHWSANTVVRFRPAEIGDADRVVLQTVPALEFGFSLGFGRVGGDQDVFISTGGFEGTDADRHGLRTMAIHELGHVIGLFHEHQRPDRNEFLDVDEACLAQDPVRAAQFVNYARTFGSRMIGPYDYNSIMHYSTQDGTKGGPFDRTDCVSYLRRGQNTRIRGNSQLSFGDVSTVNTAYAGLVGDAVARPQAGHATALGDFDGDGIGDLAIGIPGAIVAGRRGAGAVHLARRDGTPIMTLQQGRQGIDDAPEENDGFGASVAVGDFNGDGSDDLAIGVPGEDFGRLVDAGLVHVVYGPVSARETLRVQTMNQELKPLADEQLEPGDGFGYTLAVGDLDGDGVDDLAVGAPFEDFGALVDVGAVDVVPGGREGGLRPLLGERLFQEDLSLGFARTAEARFGFSLAAGDLNCDGIADLAIGSPWQSVGGRRWAGIVSVQHRTSRGATLGSSYVLHERMDLLEGFAEAGDEFGHALAIGDFDVDRRTGCADLAIGVPGEDVGDTTDTGSVQVVYTSREGAPGASQLWAQRDMGRACDDSERCAARRGERFGAALAAGRFDGDAFTDLAIGVPGEDLDAGPGDACLELTAGDRSNCLVDAGIVHVVAGSFGGLVNGRDGGVHSLHQDRLDSILRCGAASNCFLELLPVEGKAANFDRFGAVLAAGDLDLDLLEELVVGVPREVTEDRQTGAVQVFSGYEDEPLPGEGDLIVVP